MNQQLLRKADQNIKTSLKVQSKNILMMTLYKKSLTKMKIATKIRI